MRLLHVILFCGLFLSISARAEGFLTSIAMHGQPAYGVGFTHFNYVNPDAPKGGTLRLSGASTYDSFNGFINKGVAADGLGLLYASLLVKSQDEAFSMYAGLAERFEIADDRSWVTFYLRPEATWQDGAPITAEDVVWTFHTLTEEGRPAYKAYYQHVKSVTATGQRAVRFEFDQTGNRELPLIVGELAILPKHYWEGRDFTATTLEPPLGSGPYKIESFEQGRSITYSRVQDWWGKDLPVYKGRYNFDQITYEYYRDQDVSLQAFFGGEFDFRREWTAKLWATGYDVPPVESGKIVKKLVPNALPQGMQGFALNQRRDVFKDIAVRKALNYAFDFEWSNRQFAYDAYTRSNSYFANSEMAATGLPEGRELEILSAYKDQLPESLFTQEFKLPVSDGSGQNRQNLRAAMKLLDDAGYVMGQDGVRVQKDTGTRLEFEFLVASTNAAFERWFGPYKKNLERLGIKATMRIVDASAYVNRVLGFDFDMIVHSWGQSLSPGNEQRDYWGSDRAALEGSQNLIGVQDPVIDALIEDLIAAPTREDLVMHARALDRVLLHGWYVVPNWYIAGWRIAYWDKFGQPEKAAPYDLGVTDTWWAK